jgi:Berberine and berberine like
MYIHLRMRTLGPTNKEKISTWAREYWSALHSYSAGAAYVNFMIEEGEDRIRAAYGKNYDRLAKIKKRYDPGNLFRVNQNIKPNWKRNLRSSPDRRLSTASICSQSAADAAAFASPRSIVPFWPATPSTALALPAVHGCRK